MIRCSSLPLAQYCPGSVTLNRDECDRIADISSAWHAKMNLQDNAPELLAKMTQEDLVFIASLGTKVPDLKIQGLPVLVYSEAGHEVSMGLTRELRFVPYGMGDLTNGTADAYWVTTDHNGRKVLVLADLKMAKTSVLGGPNSLQLKAYAIGLADSLNCEFYVTAIYGGVESAWEVGELVEVGSEEFDLDVKQVRAAASVKGNTLVRGAHCMNCYSRLRCPAWEFLEEGETIVAPETEEGMVQLLLRSKSYEDRAERIKELAKAWVTQRGPLQDATSGKQFRAVETKGKRTLDPVAVEAALGEEGFQKCFKQGQPYSSFRWTR